MQFEARIRIRYAVVPILTSLFLATISGCGRGGDKLDRATVTGTVWIDGKPLKKGSIKFIPIGDTKGPAAASAVKDGFYELSSKNGPVAGAVRVELRDAVNLGFALDDPEAFTEHGNKPLPLPTIPPEYNIRSKLTRTVRSGETNELDFKIATRRKR